MFFFRLYSCFVDNIPYAYRNQCSSRSNGRSCGNAATITIALLPLFFLKLLISFTDGGSRILKLDRIAIIIQLWDEA